MARTGAQRKRDQREREKLGRRPIRGGAYGDEVTEMLADLRWLREDEWHDEFAIGEAISELLADSATDHMKKKKSRCD